MKRRNFILAFFAALFAPCARATGYFRAKTVIHRHPCPPQNGYCIMHSPDPLRFTFENGQWIKFENKDGIEINPHYIEAHQHEIASRLGVGFKIIDHA